MNMPNLETTESLATQLEKVFSFLSEIGIAHCLSDEEFDSFLKGVKIENGGLKINPKELLCVGDILHEAGHLACIPKALRHRANGDIRKSLGEDYTFEMGVMAWSVAAAVHLDIPLSHIFHPEGYNGEADWLLEQYSSGQYIGLPLLQWMGLAAGQDELSNDAILPFPNMLSWTRN